MVQHSNPVERTAWDDAFRKSGRKYGGAPRNLPPLPKGVRVLEIGCGDGKLLLSMLDRNWEIVAIDQSAEALRISASHPRSRSADLLQADARALPFASGSFDAVFLSHILGHLNAAGRTVAASEAGRVLVRGGSAFIRVFSHLDFRAGQGFPVESNTYLRGTGISTHYFNEDEVRLLFPGHVTVAQSTVEWDMKVKGMRLKRSEIEAEFRKV